MFVNNKDSNVFYPIDYIQSLNTLISYCSFLFIASFLSRLYCYSSCLLTVTLPVTINSHRPLPTTTTWHIFCSKPPPPSPLSLSTNLLLFPTYCAFKPPGAPVIVKFSCYIWLGGILSYQQQQFDYFRGHNTPFLFLIVFFWVSNFLIALVALVEGDSVPNQSERNALYKQLQPDHVYYCFY